MTSDNKSTPIQTQPQRPGQSANVHQDTSTPSRANIPCELESLTKVRIVCTRESHESPISRVLLSSSRTPYEDPLSYQNLNPSFSLQVEEIIFKDKVFQTHDGKTLFSVHQETEHSGSSLNLYLRDSYKKDIVWLHLISDDGGHDPYLQIVGLPFRPLGSVKIDPVSGNLNICIQTTKGTSTLIASLPMFLQTQKKTSIEILSMNGSHQVAKIMSEKEGGSAWVVFQFFVDMEPCEKIGILGAFLYLNFHLHEIRRLDNSSTRFQDVWIIDCMDWDNGSGLGSQPCGMQRDGDVDSVSEGGGCCRNCLAGCRDCLACFHDCLQCCTECCYPCLCFMTWMQCCFSC